MENVACVRSVFGNSAQKMSFCTKNVW